MQVASAVPVFGIQNGWLSYLMRAVFFLGGVSFLILISALGLVTFDPLAVLCLLSGSSAAALIYVAALKWRKRRTDAMRRAQMASALVSAVRGGLLLRDGDQIPAGEVSAGEEWFGSFELPNLAPGLATRLTARVADLDPAGRIRQALHRKLAGNNEDE